MFAKGGITRKAPLAWCRRRMRWSRNVRTARGPTLFSHLVGFLAGRGLVHFNPAEELHYLPAAPIYPDQAVEPDRVEGRVLNNVFSLGNGAMDLLIVRTADEDGDGTAKPRNRAIGRHGSVLRRR